MGRDNELVVAENGLFQEAGQFYLARRGKAVFRFIEQIQAVGSDCFREILKRAFPV